MSVNQYRGEVGAALIEFALAFLLIAVILAFVLDAGIALYRISSLNHVTTSLTRQLSTELGRAWNGNAVAAAPYNGMCNAYLREQGARYLSRFHDTSYSMSDTSSRFYFGSTLDASTALVSDPSAPYAILRVVGELAPPCVFCNFFPSIILTSESSVLVEFHSANCDDY